MIKVGLTGGIGSGKSIVSKIFNSIHIPVYVADEHSKKLLDSNISLKQALKKEFGDEIYKEETIDRKKFASIIFSNSETLYKANQIIHPFVKKDFEKWSQQHTDKDYVIEESAIIFENGIEKNLDLVIAVLAPQNIRIARVMKRDGINEERVKERIQHQVSDEEKRKRADFIIINDEKQFLIEAVLAIDKQIKEKRDKKWANGVNGLEQD